MHICIFEDEQYLNFEPLIYPRPVYDLVCGVNSLKEKILRAFPKDKVILHCRKYLEEIVKVENPGFKVNEFLNDDILFINGRVIADSNLNQILSKKIVGEKVFTLGNNIIAARLSADSVDKLRKQSNDVIHSNFFNGIAAEEIKVNCANYIWDLIYLNGTELQNDIRNIIKQKKIKKADKKKYKGVHFLDQKNIYINKNVVIKPGVVIDASNGPVYIDKNVLISSNAVIEGPVYIGEGTKIKSFASICSNVSIGKICKIGGEVEDSIIHPYTNKQHPGFLGHSYLGSWINIGADTNCSDLQNNYGTVKVQINGRHIDSGKQFLGLIMGDHTKTAINTMFNTGTVAGFSVNIFGAGFPPKYIPSFGWGGSDSIKLYKLSKALETAKVVFKRRDILFESKEEKLFEKIFELTQKDREIRGF